MRAVVGRAEEMFAILSMSDVIKEFRKRSTTWPIHGQGRRFWV